MQDNLQIDRHGDEISEDNFLQGVKDCIPTLLGYLALDLQLV